MHPISWFKGLGLGALGMYFFDPRLGRRRQSQAVDEVADLATGVVKGLDRASRDLSNRLSGAWHEVVGSLDTRTPTDDVLTARIRSKLGRVASHPRAIEVEVADGVVSLRGPVPADEAHCLLDCVGSVRGVRELNDELSRCDEDEGIAALEQAELERGEQDETEVPVFARSPGMRLAAGAVGGLLMANCAMRRRPVSILLGTVGFALVVQALSEHEASGRGASSRRRKNAGKGPDESGEPEEQRLQEQQLHDDQLPELHEPNAAAEEAMQGSDALAEMEEEVEISYSADLQDEVSGETAAAKQRARRSEASELERTELGEV